MNQIALLTGIWYFLNDLNALSMHLRDSEQILKIYHHHPTPFVFGVFKLFFVVFPFFVVLYLFKDALSLKMFIILNLAAFFIFALLIVWYSLIFWLDKLIITNIRIVHIDWKYLTVKDEAEALLQDIQDVQTEEKGFLSFLKFLDYGTLRFDTASSYVTVEFFDAPDPEEIRRFIYNVKSGNHD